MTSAEFDSSQFIEITGPMVFPLGADSVRNVFQEVSQKKMPLEGIIVNGDKSIYDCFFAENPFAYKSLENFRAEFDKESEDEKIQISLFLGYILFYGSLLNKNGNMPVGQLTEDFTQKYEEELSRRTGVSYLGTVYLDDETYRSGIPDINLNQNNQLLQEELFMKVSLLRAADREAYEAVAEGLKNNPDVNYHDEYIAAGFAQAYFLFREGLSDLYNYTPVPYIEA